MGPTRDQLVGAGTRAEQAFIETDTLKNNHRVRNIDSQADGEPDRASLSSVCVKRDLVCVKRDLVPDRASLSAKRFFCLRRWSSRSHLVPLSLFALFPTARPGS